MSKVTIAILTGVSASFFNGEPEPVVAAFIDDAKDALVLGSTGGDADATVEKNLRESGILDADGPLQSEMPVELLSLFTGIITLSEEELEGTTRRDLFTA